MTTDTSITRATRGTRSAADSGAAMALAAMFCVQLGLAVSVHMFDRLGPLGAAWLRLAWAAVILLILVRPRRGDFTRRDLLACSVLGAATAGMMLLFMSAAARIPLGTASALEFLGPLGVAMFGAKGGRKVWALLAAVGVLLLTEPWHGGVDPLGVGFALAAAAGWAAYIVLTQHVGDQVTGLKGLAVSMPVAALVATAVAAPTEAGSLSWPILLIGLGLAFLHPVLPFSLEFLALRRLTTTAFGVLMSLEPAIAVLIGLAVLGQVPGPASALGVVCVVAAGVGATRAGSRATAGIPAPATGESAASAGESTHATPVGAACGEMK